MEFQDILKKRRTIRRFKQNKVADKDILYLIEAARQASCGGNIQQLRYHILCDKPLVKSVFDGIAWGYWVTPRRVPEWDKTAPLTFILVTIPRGKADIMQVNAAAAMQSMEFAATDTGLGCCWIGAYKKELVEKLLELPEDEESLYLLAVGYPDETPVREDIDFGESMKYYLDSEDVLHVPKVKVNAISYWH